MELTGQVTGWFIVAASAGSMLIPLIIGQAFLGRRTPPGHRRHDEHVSDRMRCTGVHDSQQENSRGSS